MAASMFYGANNVKIFGGDFKTINGTYSHHEYKTTQNNHDSNNIVGNTYKDERNDHSQTIYGGNSRRNARARRAETAEEPTQHQATPIPSPLTSGYPTRPPSRSQTMPTSAMNPSAFPHPWMSNHYGNPYPYTYPTPGSVLPSIQSFTQGGHSTYRTYSETKPGDVVALNPESALYFHMLMGSLDRHDLENEEDVEDDMDIHGAEHARSQSPPVAAMAGLSLGESPPTTAGPSFPQSDPPPYYTPRTAASHLPQAQLPSTLPHHLPYQQHQPHPSAPTPNLSNLSPILKSAFNTASNAAKMQSSAHGQLFVNAPYSSSKTVYDTTPGPGPTPSIISALNLNDNVSPSAAAEAEAQTTSPGTGQSPRNITHLTFNGNFTEVSQNVQTNNYGFSGVVMDNTVESVYNRFACEDDAEDEEGVVEDASDAVRSWDRAQTAPKRKPAGHGKQGHVPPRKRRS